MIKEKMTIDRKEKEVNVYTCRNGGETYYLTLYKGEPILVEVIGKTGGSTRKVKPNQLNFKHAVEVCMSKILESDLEEFKLLGEELNPSSSYFHEFENILKDEIESISDRKSILEGMLETVRSSNS